MTNNDSATVVVTWNWGKTTVIDDFDPKTDTIFIDKVGPDHIIITESNGNVVFSIPSNKQTITLKGINLASLEPSNFIIENAGTEQKVQDILDAADNAVVEPVPGPTKPIVAGYFQGTDIYEGGRNYQIDDVPAEELTHLIYAFITIDENDEVKFHDEWGAIKHPFDDANSVDGVGDTSNQALKGNMNQLAELKEAHPDLQIIISIGGAGLSRNFSSMVASEDSREIFVNSVVEFLKTYPMFDGVDLDWEFPNGGEAENEKSPDDGKNYALLAKDIRAVLDGLGTETGRDYSLSVASPTGSQNLSNFNLEGLAPHVNFFNMMAYDMHGHWSKNTGHQAPIENTGNGTNGITDAVDAYLDSGVPANKIVIGAPTYTKAWKGVDADDAESSVRAHSDGAAQGTHSPGSYDYDDLLGKLQDPESGWKLYYDDNAQAAYLWNEEEKIYSTFETPETIALKSEWAQEKGLGGMMFWALSSDASGQESLVKAASDSWLKDKTLMEIANASDLEFEEVFGGNGKVAPYWDQNDPGGPEGPGNGDTIQLGSEADKIAIKWDWGEQLTYSGFDPAMDVLDFTNLPAKSVSIEESGDDLLITVIDNGEHSYLFKGLQAEDLTIDNITATSWNHSVIGSDKGVAEQLSDLGALDMIV
ncbi:MAG: glycoside hydrolase family 18 protein [Methyloligellaceae bacterium]